MRPSSVIGVLIALAFTLLVTACGNGEADPCLGVDCGPNSTGCVGEDGQAMCLCEDGWAGTRCDSCDEGWLDVDGDCLPSCAVVDLDCGEFGACDDNEGEPICVCDEGYAGEFCEACDEGYDWLDGVCLPECECEIENGHGECVDGVCVIIECEEHFESCDEDVSTGCETPTNTLTDCGDCGVTCEVENGTATCSGGTCEVESCDDGFFNCDDDPLTGCESTLPCHCEEEDWPDPEDFRDRNCDGVVGGDASIGVFVSHFGSDDNDGTRHRPVRTIERAVEIARADRPGPRREVYIAEGDYEGANVGIASLHGGYKDLGGGDWDRGPDYETIITSTLQMDGGEEDATIELIKIDVPNAEPAGTQAGSHGRSVVGLALADNTGTFHVNHVDIVVGNASSGRQGRVPHMTPNPGYPGSDGAGSSSGDGANQRFCTGGMQSFAGGDGGDGGEGTQADGNAGLSGDGRVIGQTTGAGGAGGTWGREWTCGHQPDPVDPTSGQPGADGAMGAQGNRIAAGDATGALSYGYHAVTGVRSLYYSPPTGEAGDFGAVGRGGGGGGGAGSYRAEIVMNSCNWIPGGGGGGGGSGGCPGEGGGPGGSGGASIGILVREANVEISNTRIETGRGGHGGDGAVGVEGAVGGAGATGAPGAQIGTGTGLAGADSGDGGRGGRGGGGSGGAGGPSVGILHAGSTITVDSDTVTFERGSEGVGGTGGGTDNDGPDGVRESVFETEIGEG